MKFFSYGARINSTFWTHRRAVAGLPFGGCYVYLKSSMPNRGENLRNVLVLLNRRKLFYVDVEGKLNPIDIDCSAFLRNVEQSQNNGGKESFFLTQDQLKAAGININRSSNFNTVFPKTQKTSDISEKTNPSWMDLLQTARIDTKKFAKSNTENIALSPSKAEKTFGNWDKTKMLCFLLYLIASWFWMQRRSYEDYVANQEKLIQLFPELNEKFFKHLLENVVRGEQYAAEKILKTNPGYLLARSDFLDCSGRHFKNVTVFEYALWAMDAHMYKMMIRCVPENDIGMQLRQALLEQYEAVEKYGLAYVLDGQSTFRNSHFDFKPLLDALEAYIQNEKSQSSEECLHWTAIAKAQYRVPAHVVNEYCHSDRSFFPTPTFQEGDLPRSVMVPWGFKSTAWWNATQKEAVTRGGGHHWNIFIGTRNLLRTNIRFNDNLDWVVSIDLKAMAALRDARTADLIQLGNELRSLASERIQSETKQAPGVK